MLRTKQQKVRYTVGKMIGIDVSEHNGSLDWAKIRAAGVSYAIIRGGYGRYKVDEQFHANIKGALAQSIPVGVYWFTYALDAAGAKAEARKCLEAIGGYEVQLPVFFDFEYDTVRYGKDNGVTLGKAAFNDHAVAFCEEIRAAGYTPGVYYNLDYYRNMVDSERLRNYVVWYAQYASSPSIAAYDIWQYSSSGSIDGIGGRFDMNELKNTALLGGGKYAVGWHKDSRGWWYADTENSYYAGKWAEIGGKWYCFDAGGYMLASQWAIHDGNRCYLGADGAMAAGRSLKIGTDGKLLPAGNYYDKLSEVPDMYRGTLEKLIADGTIQGREGAGEELVLDMSEDMVRLLVILDRAGVFGG